MATALQHCEIAGVATGGHSRSFTGRDTDGARGYSLDDGRRRHADDRHADGGRNPITSRTTVFKSDADHVRSLARDQLRGLAASR